MDVKDPLHLLGARFVPQLPPLDTEPVRPFLASLELEFEIYFRNGPNRKALSPDR